MLSKTIVFVLVVCSLTLNTESKNLNYDNSIETDITVGQVQYHLDLSERVSWIKAQESCRSRGMQLAAITSSEENYALQAAIMKIPRTRISRLNSKFWTSGTDLPSTTSSRNFYWLSTGRPFTYVNWAQKTYSSLDWYADEPDNLRGKEHCVEAIKVNGLLVWNDATCNSIRYFICEVRA